MALPEWGRASQLLFENSRILCVGAGGLGSAALTYLASAGVGTLGLVDADEVELSNLPRQILFRESDVGVAKVKAARDRLQELRLDLNFEIFKENISLKNAEKIIQNFDLVIDGTDNFSTKFLLSDFCVKLGKPLVMGSVNQWEGHVGSFYAHRGPCYRCFQKQRPTIELPSCETGGVLGPAVGVIGSLQALESLKVIQALGGLAGKEYRFGQILFFDFLELKTFRTNVQPWSGCTACGAQALPLPIANFDTSAAEISPEELSHYLTPEAIVLDLCEEPKALQGGRHRPWSFAEVLLRKTPSDLNLKSKILIVCEAGLKAREAIVIMQELGFENVKILRGGRQAWRRSS